MDEGMMYISEPALEVQVLDLLEEAVKMQGAVVTHCAESVTFEPRTHDAVALAGKLADLLSMATVTAYQLASARKVSRPMLIPAGSVDRG